MATQLTPLTATRGTGDWAKTDKTGQRSEPAELALRMALGTALGRARPTDEQTTTAALKEFQKANKLPQTGELDGVTIRALNGSTLAAGDKGPAVTALREDMEQLGYKFSTWSSRDVFDDQLAAAVADFQSKAKVKGGDDSIVGMDTRFAIAKNLIAKKTFGTGAPPSAAETPRAPGTQAQNIGLGDIARNRPKYVQTVNPGDKVSFSLPINMNSPDSMAKIELVAKRSVGGGKMQPFDLGNALEVKTGADGKAQYTLTVPKDWPKDKPVELTLESKSLAAGTVRLKIPPSSEQLGQVNERRAADQAKRAADQANRTPVFAHHIKDQQKITEAFNQLPNDLRKVLVENARIDMKEANLSTSPQSQATTTWQRGKDGKYDVYLGNITFYVRDYRAALEAAAKSIQKHVAERAAG